MSEVDKEKINAQIKKWQEKLIDLTKSNPLLRLNHSRVSKLQVIEPDLANLYKSLVEEGNALKMPLIKRGPAKGSRSLRDKQQQIIVDEIVEEEPEYLFDPGDVTFSNEPKELWRLQKRIYDNARTTVEERGVTTLHLVLGVLKWDDPEYGDPVSPLILIPCTFDYAGPNVHMKLKMADEEIQLNPALELILREKHKTILPPLPESEELDVRKYMASVAASVQEQGWTVEPEVWLSTFSFESLVIYKDLDALTEIAHQNSLIAALANANQAPLASEALGEPDDLDSNPDTPIPVLNADSSQLSALVSVAAGQNVIIHGPPGTGKSQTITNLIADALSRGKKVLFVSAKMAALNVVYDRLVSLGMERFCLEAHSTKAGKAKIIEELKRTVDVPNYGGGQLLEEQFSELQRVRTQLNSYIQELHTKREPLNISLYQALGKVEKLNNTVDLQGVLPWQNPLEVTREQLRDAQELLHDLASQASVFDNRNEHPWRGLKLNNERRAASREELRRQINRLLDTFQAVDNSLSVIGDLFSIKEEATLNRLDRVKNLLELTSKVSALPVHWRMESLDTHTKLANVYDEAAQKVVELKSENSKLAGVTSETAERVILTLQPLEIKFTDWTRVLKPEFWKWRLALKNHFHKSTKLSTKDLLSYLKTAKKVSLLEKWFSHQRRQLSQFAPEPLKVSPKDLISKATEHKAAAELLVLAQAGVIALSESNTLTQDIIAQARSVLERLRDPSLDSLTAFTNEKWPGGFIDSFLIKDSPIDSVVTKCKDLLAAFHKYQEWVVLQITLHKCAEANLIPLIESLQANSAQLLPEAFSKKFFTLWAEEVMSQSEALQEFSGMRREVLIKRLRDLDLEIEQSATKRTQATAAEPARKVFSAQSGMGPHSEIGILNRELNKRRRFKPLRKLFAEIPHVLQALKPCFLMSPTSVSTFLKPGKFTFDLVVFDEASQLPTQEAVAAILRSNQVVVAGDENQLPPTSFFDTTTWFGEEDDEDEYEPLESLLDDCCAINPMFSDKRLMWHYRSKDERLIKFSNHNIYDNKLITFPSATVDTEGRGVRLEYIDGGTWDRGKSRTNRTEARKVAQIVVEQLEKYPERSLGVVAMNTSQREAIELALDEMIISRPHLSSLLDTQKPEPFFVKSLENVQGDERDVIIISVGYAKTPEGSFSFNFGPINRDGGWRRLNVLVTRAKWQTILVTSMRSSDLSGINPGNRGAVMLRDYIAYAENNCELPARPAIITEEETNDFENAIADELRAAGCLVDEQVGASGYRIDIAVRDPRNPNKYLLAVECDGATYHSSKTARDRDMLRQDVLKSQGWKIYRVWSTDWFRDRESAAQNLLHAVNTALQFPEDESIPAPPQKDSAEKKKTGNTKPAIKEPVKLQVPDRRFQVGIPYKKISARRLLSKDLLIESYRYYDFAKLIAAIAQKEGPIHTDLLLDRLRELCGVARIGANIRSNFRTALQYAGVKYGVKQEGDFVYSTKDPETFRVNSEEVQRTPNQIAPEEIALAACYLAEDQFGFARERLPKAIAEVFGIKRATAEALDYISEVVDQLLTHHVLNMSGHMLYVQEQNSKPIK